MEITKRQDMKMLLELYDLWGWKMSHILESSWPPTNDWIILSQVLYWKRPQGPRLLILTRNHIKEYNMQHNYTFSELCRFPQRCWQLRQITLFATLSRLAIISHVWLLSSKSLLFLNELGNSCVYHPPIFCLRPHRAILFWEAFPFLPSFIPA